MRKLYSIVLSILFAITAFGQTSQTKDAAKNEVAWKTLNESAYSIEYPENWELNTSGQMGTSFVLLSEQSSPQDQFKENINLYIEDLSGHNINLGKYVEITEGHLEKMVTNRKLIESKRLIKNDLEFHKIIYTG